MNTEEMTKNVQKLEELDTLIDQAREEAEVKKNNIGIVWLLGSVFRVFAN